MPGSKDDGFLGGIVLVLALLLAGFIVFRLGGRYWAGGRGAGASSAGGESASASPRERGRVAPARVPPMKLIRTEPKRASEPVLPSRPMPPITPDRQ